MTRVGATSREMHGVFTLSNSVWIKMSPDGREQLAAPPTASHDVGHPVQGAHDTDRDGVFAAAGTPTNGERPQCRARPQTRHLGNPGLIKMATTTGVGVPRNDLATR